LPPEAQTLDQTSAYLPGGAYTTFRTYGGSKALRLGDHLCRLVHTARMAGKDASLDEHAARAALRLALNTVPGGQDYRIRLTLDLEAHAGDLYLLLQPVQPPPPEAYQTGVKVVTCDLQRQLPKAKLTRFIARAGQVRQKLPAEVNEAIMADPRGNLLEGLSSNFFAVKEGEIWSAEAGVLSGVTRALALECAIRLGMRVHLQPVRLTQIPELEEAFITSSSRAVMPIRQIDRVQIGKVCPGRVTQAVMQEYADGIERLVEEI
jgi:branched-chain amino acid aminotransferase